MDDRERFRQKRFSHLPNEIHQRIFVVVPNRCQFFARWKFTTTQFECQFKTIAGQIIEILHSTTDRIPNDKEQ